MSLNALITSLIWGSNSCLLTSSSMSLMNQIASIKGLNFSLLTICSNFSTFLSIFEHLLPSNLPPWYSDLVTLIDFSNCYRLTNNLSSPYTLFRAPNLTRCRGPGGNKLITFLSKFDCSKGWFSTLKWFFSRDLLDFDCSTQTFWSIIRLLNVLASAFGHWQHFWGLFALQ